VAVRQRQRKKGARNIRRWLGNVEPRELWRPLRYAGKAGLRGLPPGQRRDASFRDEQTSSQMSTFHVPHVPHAQDTLHALLYGTRFATLGYFTRFARHSRFKRSDALLAIIVLNARLLCYLCSLCSLRRIARRRWGEMNKNERLLIEWL
jgi:hypothetical protein